MSQLLKVTLCVQILYWQSVSHFVFKLQQPNDWPEKAGAAVGEGELHGSSRGSPCFTSFESQANVETSKFDAI